MSIKDLSIEALKHLPENSTFEDIMYEINLIAQVYEGVEDADEGKLIETASLLKLVDEWKK